ncbi:MAG: hypothetical protein ACOH1R_06740 [Luteimonas sp.]
MRYAKVIIQVIIICALAGLTLSCSGKKVDNSMSGTLPAFIEYKTSQNYQGLWNSSSAHFRSSNDNDEAAYEKYARSYGVHPNRVSVLSIGEYGSEAKIKVNVHYVQSNGDIAGSAVEEWRFVSEKGSWYFDGYRTISESAQ